MAVPYFPVEFYAMSARRKFRELDGGESFLVGSNKVTARWLNHPQGCLGFRIETPSGIVVYATDNEPGDPALDQSLKELAADADILINDAQFTPSQRATTRKGWGHSSWRGGGVGARGGDTKNSEVLHHDPTSTGRLSYGLCRHVRER